MTRYPPFSILLLLLTLCVLGAGFTSFAHCNAPLAAVELEQELQEGMGNLLEEEVSVGTDAVSSGFCTRDVILPPEAALPLKDVCRQCFFLCSFGWVLPLRI
ncbi:MAG TPA: hypothetical protein VLL07_03245, partial [Pontiella sp.]|nr:hypothetical protein [Pontiella sp.]